MGVACENIYTKQSVLGGQQEQATQISLFL